MERVPTHVEGLDEALDGGVPRGSVVLVAGAPGTFKTSLTFSILYRNVKEGAKGLFISLEEGQETLKDAMVHLGMDDVDDIELYILDVAKIRLEHREEELEKDWVQILQKYISQRVKTSGFDLIVVDSISALHSLGRMENPRRELFHLFGFLKGLGATVLLISELRPGETGHSPFDEDFLADGVLLLKQHELPEGDVRIRIRCVKMRKTHHPHSWFTLTHRKGRFIVSPSSAV
jgi:KaiC/GvpD/RAD55 family RecA-like ATPase